MAKIRHSDGSVVLHGRAVGYRLFRVPRRRRLQLVAASDGRVHIRAPYRCSRAQAEAVLFQHGLWALEALKQVESALRKRPTLSDDSDIPLLNECLRLRFRPGARGQIRRVGRNLWVSGPDLGQERLRVLVEGWYRTEAQAFLGKWLEELAAVLGVQPKRLTIRGQSTRWGSCSCHGNISLNWRLMLLPADLVEYVIVHELCHLRHFNHGPAFWAMVASQVPDWSERRAQLRAFQPSLLF